MNIIENQFECPEMPQNEITDYLIGAGYRLNRHGYRCDEFDDRKEINVVTIGCSNAFGWALDEEHRFSDIFIQKLKAETGKTVANWNIGEPAKSNDYIARQAANAQRLLKPDLFLILLTDITRREYFSIDYRVQTGQGCFNYISAEYPKGVKKNHPHFMQYAHRFYGLTSPHDDLINTYKNLKFIEGCLGNTPWLAIALCQYEIEPMMKFFDNFVMDECYTIVDMASDNQHPGPRSNQEMADMFFKRYKDDYLD